MKNGQKALQTTLGFPAPINFSDWKKEMPGRYKQRLYMVFAAFVCVLAASEGIQHGMAVELSWVRYLLLSAATLMFFYVVALFARDVVNEIRARQPGISILLLSLLTICYVYSIETFFVARSINSFTEFAMLLLVLVLLFVLARAKNETMSTAYARQQGLLDDIVGSVDEVIWAIDPATQNIIFINEASLQTFGHTPSEMMQDKDLFFESIYPDDRPHFYEALGEVLANGYAEAEFRVFHKNGSIRYLNAVARMRKGTTAQEDMCCGITRDITRQREAELKLLQHTKEVENVLNSIRDGFFALDAELNFTYINAEFERTFACKASGIIGRPADLLLCKDAHRELYSECAKAMNEKMVGNFETFCSKLNKWFSMKVYPSRTGVAVYFTDITREKQLLDQMLEDKVRLTIQNQQLAEMAWIQSHKVRSPLANMLGLIPLLNFKDPTDADNKYILENIRSSGERLDNVIREISESTHCESDDFGNAYSGCYKSHPVPGGRLAVNC